jgi:protein TonB
MTEAGYYQQKRISPIGMATVVLLHGTVLTALLMAKGDFVQRIIDPPTHIDFIPENPVPPEKLPPQPPKPHTAQTRMDTPKPLVKTPPTGPTVYDSPIPWTPPAPPGPTPTVLTDPIPLPPPTRRTFEPARARANLGSYVSNADYPDSASRDGEQGTTRFRLSVGPDGRVTDCTVTGSSGSSALDATTCRLMKSRARFTPARDSNGNPATDNVASAIHWELPAG